MLRGRANHKGLHHRLEDTFALERATGVSKSAAAGRPATPPCWPMSTPTVNGATWPVWSGSSANAAAATGSRPTSASSFPVCPPEPGPCCRRCGNTGASRMHTTGSWTWPLARTTAASARAMPPTTWPSQAYRPQPTKALPSARPRAETPPMPRPLAAPSRRQARGCAHPRSKRGRPAPEHGPRTDPAHRLRPRPAPNYGTCRRRLTGEPPGRALALPSRRRHRHIRKESAKPAQNCPNHRGVRTRHQTRH